MVNKKKSKSNIIAFAQAFVLTLLFILTTGCSSQTSEISQTSEMSQTSKISQTSNRPQVVDGDIESVKDKFKDAKPFTQEETLKITEEKYKEQLKLLRKLDWNKTENDILKNGNINRLVSLLNTFKESEYPRFTIVKPNVKDVIKDISKYYGEKINFRGKIVKIEKDIQEDSLKESFDGKKYSKVLFDIKDDKTIIYIYGKSSELSEFKEGDNIDFSGWTVGTSGNILVLVNKGII